MAKYFTSEALSIGYFYIRHAYLNMKFWTVLIPLQGIILNTFLLFYIP